MTDEDVIVVKRLFAEGMAPAQVSVILNIDISELMPYATVEREALAADADQLTVGMAKFAWRAFEEGMRLLDEGTPAIKARLIGSAMGHTLRLLRTQSPKEFDDLRSEMAEILKSQSTDDTDPNSIYSTSPEADIEEDAEYYTQP